MEKPAIKEYPRIVYGPAGETKRINEESEWPDGWKTHPSLFTTEAETEAEEAKKAAALTADEEKKALKAFLDEHRVEYHPNLGTPKLRELAEQLKEHLKKQGNGDGA